MNAPHPGLRSPNWRTHAFATSSREVQVQKFRIEVVSGPNRGQIAAAEAEELCVGTAPANHLVLTDPTVSRHHLSITATEDGFQLRDLSSTSGTFLAGYRVEVAYIDSGALIQAGETTVRFDVMEERTSHPLSERDRFGDVLGQSAAMRRVFAMLERAAPTDTTILLEGETGTGKGALAEMIHRQSARASGPFVVVDCGSIPPNLIESELFGHEGGSFTGAEERRIGAFGAADGGTIFLDEIGELGADLQPKLLRALEAHQIRRIGSVEPVPVDVRVIAATNRDLRHEVNAGSFRPDLFYRLNVRRVTVPPLRERREDIPLLVAHFYRQSMRSPDAAPPAELITGLLRQPWAGNVRELRSAVERSILLGQSAATLDQEHPPAGDAWPALDFTISFRESKEGALAVWTRIYVRELVDRYGGNLSRAARAVSMDRNHLRDLLHKYAMNGIDPQ